MGTTTLLDLDERLLRSCGDWLQATVTTAITASASIISTALKNYDHTQDGFFDNWWVYIEDYANAGDCRLIGSTTYSTATGRLYIYGANLLTDGANKATFRLSKLASWDMRADAINRAIEDTYPALHKRLDDRTLITGNILPDSHFESWSSATAMNWYTKSGTGTFAQESSTIRGGTYAAKYTAGAADDTFDIDSEDYPKLLDLRGQSVTFRCWVYPEVADDAFIEIYTLEADGTAQTLTSTTANPATKWTLIELEDQDINDDIQYISIRFRTETNAKYVIFDDARLIGRNVYDYLLPDDFEAGHLSQPYEQIDTGYAGDPGEACDNIGAGVMYSPIWGTSIIDDGTNKYLHTPTKLSSERRIKLIGYTNLGVLDSTDSTDTIPISDGGQLNTLIALADYYLNEKVGSPVGADDITRYEREMAKKWAKYQSLLRRHRMPKPAETMNVVPLG